MIRRNRLAFGAGLALAVIVAAGLLAPLIAPFDPNAQDLAKTLQPPGGGHLLGTDNLGRDIFSRLLYAIRVDFAAAFAAVTIGLVIGVPLGFVLGTVRKLLDAAGSIFVDAALAIPPLVFILTIVAVVGRGLPAAVLGLGLVFSLPFLRIVRGEVLAVREEPFVRAARAAGVPSRRILRRHVLPEVVPAIVVQITVLLPAAFLIEASLSYLALSVQPPTASLGSMLMSAQEVALTAPWQVLPPGLLLIVVTILLNLLADAMSVTLSARPSITRLLASARGPRRVSPPPPSADEATPALAIDRLQIAIRDGDGVLHAAVRDVSVTVERGEIVALVGESGSGKTLTAMSVLGLLPAAAQLTGGSLRVQGVECAGASPRRLREMRAHEVGVVFQDPLACLDPSRTIGDQLIAVLTTFMGHSRRSARLRAIEGLDEVGVTDPERRLTQYPHELSGGIAQRIMIAMALSREPSLLIADEPTSALDATIQRQVLDLLATTRERRGLAILIVTHNMGVVAHIADRVVVMYGGEVVETGPAAAVLAAPSHPYTHALLSAVPRNLPRTGSLPVIRSGAPGPGQRPDGCAFAPRCPRAEQECRVGAIEMTYADNRAWRCVRADQLAPIREASG